MDWDHTCDTYVWASIGIITRDGTVSRIRECEQCLVWTAEPFDPDFERDWDATWLSGH